ASAEAFLAELRHGLDSSRPPVVTARETGAIDFNKTVATPFTATGTNAPPEETGFGASFDSMAGTVSAASLDSDVQQQVASANEAYRREQEQRDRIAREEVAREAEHKRKVQEEADRKRKQEEERVRKEKEEREEKERQQREQIERVSRQAKELEERLERLATSMPPQAAVLDPEATQVHHNVLPTEVMGYKSFPSVPSPAVSR